MENKASYTLRLLLEELGKNIPPFRVGQVFETIKSVYPTSEVKRSKRNIIVEGVEITKPCAVGKKSKQLFLKDKSPFADFYSDFKHGDLLKIVKIENNTALCENISFKKEVKEKYYKDDLVKISKEDIINGVIRQVKRNVNRIIEGVQK
jgi:hypothetical protein